jgi:hypothetical protein
VATIRNKKSKPSSQVAPLETWRTVVRIIEVDHEIVKAVIPSWNTNTVVNISVQSIPERIRSQLKKDVRLFARVNVGSKSVENLRFEQFELP